MHINILDVMFSSFRILSPVEAALAAGLKRDGISVAT
jgi:hypothetical protein